LGRQVWGRKLRERVIELLLFLAAFSSVLVTTAIVAILLYESYGFFQHVSVAAFLTDTMWTPLFAEPRYGILPLLSGTLLSTAVGLVVAIPLGMIISIYLSEFAPAWLREVLKPFLEILGGIPTVVYGYFALLAVTPLLQRLLPSLPTFNVLSPGIVIGIMIIPYISSLSEDAMRAVPNSLREASYAAGATKLQTAWKVVVPAATSGIVAAFVAIAAGQQPNLTWNPMEPAATITAYIVQVALGDLPHGSVGYQTIFAAGLTLMLITLVFNLIAYVLRMRYREAY
jgi:phosphate transport system permease protein